jgi:hypothetical protein
LVPVILVGAFVVIPPQTYIMLLDKGLVHAGYFHFWVFSYLAADQTLVAPLHRTMPTYDHLWFIVYLLIYTLIFAAFAWTVRVLARIVPGMPQGAQRLPLWLLLTVPALWLAAVNFMIERRFPVTFDVVNDWGSHLKWAGMFLTGILCAPRDDFWEWVRQRRATLLACAALSFALQSVCHAIWLAGQADPLTNAVLWSAATSFYAWAMVCALCGYGQEHMNKSSAILSHLNEAILPIYVLHQPILLIFAYFLFPLKLPLPIEGAMLVAITGLGALGIYEAAIRPFRIMRKLFGLKPDWRERAAYNTIARTLPSSTKS